MPLRVATTSVVARIVFLMAIPFAVFTSRLPVAPNIYTVPSKMAAPMSSLSNKHGGLNPLWRPSALLAVGIAGGDLLDGAGGRVVDVRGHDAVVALLVDEMAGGVAAVGLPVGDAVHDVVLHAGEVTEGVVLVAHAESVAALLCPGLRYVLSGLRLLAEIVENKSLATTSP